MGNQTRFRWRTGRARRALTVVVLVLAGLGGLLLSLLMLGPAASAPTALRPNAYYVSPVGNDGDGLSWASAWKSLGTIKWSVVQPGDTLFLDGGSSGITYTSTLAVGKSGTALAPITIRVSSVAGHNGRVLIFGGRGTPLPYCGQTGYKYQTSGVRLHGITFNNASHVVIDGGKWDGLAVYGHDNDGVLFSGGESYDTLRNAEVYDNGTASVNSAGAWSTDAAGIRPLGSHLTFDQVDVHDNGQDALQSGGPLNYITIHHSWLHFARQNPLQPAGSAFNTPCTHQDGLQIYAGDVQSGVTIQDSVLGPGLIEGVMLGQAPYVYNGVTYSATIHDVTVRNSLVINGAHNGLIGDPGQTQNNWTIDHTTIFMNASEDALSWMGNNASVTNSIVYGGGFYLPTGLAVSGGNCQWNTGAGSTQIKGLTANPLFNTNVSGFGAFPSLTTQASADFGLQTITPCPGVGSSMTSVAMLISTAA
jgi:hypothetical protein